MAENPNGVVPVHELVYGSAAKVLAPGASDLGVIASSRNFPAEASRWLGTHRSYTGERSEGQAQPVKYFIGSLGRYFEVTRVEQGIDHTRRVLAFAHHLAAEQTAIQASGMSFGRFIGEAVRTCRDPRGFQAGWIDPPATVSGRGVQSCSPTTLKPEVLTAIVAAVIRYQADKRPVLLVAGRPASSDPKADPFLPIICAVADLLPDAGRGALVAVTHVVEMEDRLAEASILCTYPGTAFHREFSARQGSRAPLMVDCVTGAASALPSSTDPFVRATIADLKAKRPGRFAGLCDTFQAREAQYEAVAALAAAAERLDASPTLSSLEGLLVCAKKCESVGNRPRFEEWVAAQIDRILAGQAGPLLADVAGQPQGPVRLAKALAASEAALELLGRVGATAQSNGRSGQADAVAAALLSLGSRGKVIGRRVADVTRCPDFRERFADVPASEPVISTPAEKRPLPQPRAAGSNQLGQGEGRPRNVGVGGGLRDPNWRQQFSDGQQGGGLLVPTLCTLVTILAFLMPGVREALQGASLTGNSEARSEPTERSASNKEEAIAGWNPLPTLKQASGRLWSKVVSMEWPALISLALIPLSVLLLWFYKSLSGWLGTNLPEWTAILPLLAAVAVAATSAAISLKQMGLPAH